MLRRYASRTFVGWIVVLVAISCPAQEGSPTSPLAPPLTSALHSISNPMAGQQYRLRHIIISGNTRTKETLILHMIPIEEGQLFNQSRWDAGIEQLNRSGLFKPITPADVVMKPIPQEGVVDIELHLTEADHHRVDFSGGAGTTGGAGLSFDYSDTNLTGRGDRLRGRVIFGTRQQVAAGQYSLSLISQRQPLFDFGGYYERALFVDARLANGEREPLYLQQSAGGSAGVSFALTPTRYAITAPTRAGVTYSFNVTNSSDRLTTAVLSTTTPSERVRSGSVTMFLLHDTLDRQFDPQKGERLSIALELEGRALGGSLNTVQPVLDYRRFFALSSKDEARPDKSPVIGFRFRAANISPFGASFENRTLSVINGVPVFKRYFIGGETEIRGYDVNSIAPLARVERFLPGPGGELMLASSEVRPIGGDTKVLFNAELRVPLFWQFSAAAFFDIGTSFNSHRLETEQFTTQIPNEPLGMIDLTTVVSRATEPQFQLPVYRYSVGAELRVLVPILNTPLRFIFAANPNAQTHPPPTAVIAPEKRFAFRFGFSRTL